MPKGIGWTGRGRTRRRPARRSGIRELARGLAAAACVLVLAVPAAAQQVHGTVVDLRSGDPLVGAVISAIDRDTTMVAATLSDSAGAFRLRITPADPVERLRVEAYGYVPVDSVPVAFGGRDPVQVEIRLRPRPFLLEGVTARVEGWPPRDNLAGFLERRGRRFGKFLGPVDIAALHATSSDFLLTSIPGIRPDYEWGGIVARHYSLRGAGFEIEPRRTCSPSVYLDGRLLDDWYRVSMDWYVPHHAIRAVELYLEPRDAPARYHRSGWRSGGLGCAIMLIWTDRGFGFRWEERDPGTDTPGPPADVERAVSAAADPC